MVRPDSHLHNGEILPRWFVEAGAKIGDFVGEFLDNGTQGFVFLFLLLLVARLGRFRLALFGHRSNGFIALGVSLLLGIQSEGTFPQILGFECSTLGGGPVFDGGSSEAVADFLPAVELGEIDKAVDDCKNQKDDEHGIRLRGEGEDDLRTVLLVVGVLVVSQGVVFFSRLRRSQDLVRTSNFLESFFRLGVLGLVGVPMPRESSVTLRDHFLRRFFRREALVVEPKNAVAIELSAKDVFRIVVASPIKVRLDVESVLRDFLGKRAGSPVVHLGLGLLLGIFFRGRRCFVVGKDNNGSGDQAPHQQRLEGHCLER
mmetsp:Transcript_26668/g.73355  ORF Transcript_26668/g.73355 Transcript_26668/m.73355 type:complete len:315 (+) Transcript_26668:551-1495(+)